MEYVCGGCATVLQGLDPVLELLAELGACRPRFRSPPRQTPATRRRPCATLIRASIRLDSGLSPPSCRSCSHKQNPRRLPAGGLSLPGSLRRSWIEVALPAEHCGPDVLVVEDEDRGPRARRGHDGGAFEGGVALGVQHFEADIELRHRVPLRPRAGFPEVVVGAAAVAREGLDRAQSGRDPDDAASRRHAGQARLDQGGRIVAVVDVDVAAERTRCAISGSRCARTRRERSTPG